MIRNRLFGAIAGIIGVTMIGMAAPAWADDFDHAFNAYAAGDFAAARTMLDKLAVDGDIRAQYLMGRIFSEGEGVPKDDVVGVKWYSLAAFSGDTVSQLALGTMYVNGRGVAQDLVQAYGWFTIVAQDSSRDMTNQALEVRDLIEQLMSTQDINEAEAFAASWQPQ